MPALVRIARISALAHVATYLAAMVFLRLVLPRLGIPGMEALNDAGLTLSVIRTHPALLLYPAADFLLAVTLVLFAASFPFGSGQGRELVGRVAAPFAYLAAGLNVLGATVRVFGFRFLAHLPELERPRAVATYEVLNVFTLANSRAVFFLTAAWILTVHAIAWRNGFLRRPAAALGIAAGLIGLMTPVFFPGAIVTVFFIIFRLGTWGLALRHR